MKKHTQDVGEQRKSDPVLEWLRYENEKVYQSCNKRESKVGEEEPKDRMSNFNAKVHAMAASNAAQTQAQQHTADRVNQG